MTDDREKRERLIHQPLGKQADQRERELNIKEKSRGKEAKRGKIKDQIPMPHPVKRIRHSLAERMTRH